jgi:transcriptional regulator with XRE-family HTH domain
MTTEIKPPKTKIKNCLQEILSELMTEKRVELADVQKATGIPFPTLWGWATAKTGTQLLDENVLKLAQYFDVTIEYLAFGIGHERPNE